MDRETADAALAMLEVDTLGLDVMDRKLLLAIMEKFGGGPALLILSSFIVYAQTFPASKRLGWKFRMRQIGTL